jgi:RNA methyltransferase, TrmH family
MPVRIVQSKQNARLKALRRALAKPPRGPVAEGNGLAGIEGPNLLAEAIRSGLRLECIFVAEGSESLLEELTIAPGIEVLIVPSGFMSDALTTETPQLIAALVEPPDWTWAHLLGTHQSSAPLIVVLAGLQDPGNLGTVLRSAEAFGANGVVSLPGTVSAWNAKAVRASAGSVFRVPILEADADDCFLRLREAKVRILTTALRGATPVADADLREPVAFLVGNEGNGVPDDIAAQAQGAVTIPCPGPVESLNAAVAASVLLYETSRQRERQEYPPSLFGSNP